MRTTTTWRCSSTYRSAPRAWNSTPPTNSGEDATGLTGWSIKDKFDWKNSGTWQQKGGGNEAIQITVNGYERPANQDHRPAGGPGFRGRRRHPGSRHLAHRRRERAPLCPAFPSGELGGPDDGRFVFNFSYQWIRVDGGTDTNIGTDSPRYQLADADFGKQIKVRVSFTDQHDYSETVASVPFGPIARPASLPSPSTLVGNTGQSPTATKTITGDYAMGFKLGTPRPGLRDPRASPSTWPRRRRA